MQMKNIAALGALCAMAGVVGAAQAETVTVNGSTTVLPAMQLVAEGFMKANPNVTITISGTGSGNGIKALMDNTTDIAMSSRDLKKKEADDLAKAGHKPVRFTVAYDAIIPVVNNKNAVKELTIEQLRDIYAGKIRDWKEVGGAAAPIVVIGRDTSSVWARPAFRRALFCSPRAAALSRLWPATRTRSATSASATLTTRRTV